MRKNLVYLTERYPHENIGGVFEEKELLGISHYYDKIIAISAVSETKFKLTGLVPDNVIPACFEPNRSIFQKVLSLRFVFTKVFFDEIKFVKRILNLKISLRLIGVLLVELNNSVALSKFISRLLKANSMVPSDTLLYSFWNDYRAIGCVILKKRNPDFAVISRCHGGDVYYERHICNYLPLKGFMLKYLDALYPISDSGRDYLIDKLNDRSGKIISKKLGVKNDFLLEEYSPGSKIIIASCSQIVPIKRLHLLVAGLSELKEIEYKWYHLGADWMNGEISNLAENKLGTHGDKYEFCGMMTNDEVMSFYHINKPDIFINTSSSEGIPVSVMEAMSFGIVVIATAVGSTPEIVKDGYNGFLLTPDPTAYEIASTIKKYAEMPAEYKRIMRNNAYSTWNEYFNSEKNYKDFIDCIKSY
jgi:glycosyltransferase involved in cell wall biosynthesis